MNLSSFTQRAISAKLLAGITIVSILLSAFPAAFFVANAASTGLTLNASALSVEAGAQVNFKASVTTDDSIYSTSTSVVATDGGSGGEFFTGTINGACNSASAVVGGSFSIDQNKGICYANDAAGIYIITVALIDNEDSSTIDTQNVEITVTEAVVSKINICHWNEGGQSFSLLNVDVNSIGTAHGNSGANDGDVIPVVGEYLGQNLDADYNGITGAELLVADCVVPFVEPDPVEPDPIVKSTEYVVVTGDTAAAENLPGWMFNRDLNNSTPIEFNEAESVLGTGALYVLPISNTDAPRKFIGEYFWQGMIASLDGFSYDFKIGAGGADTYSGEFYLNVYANFAESASDKYYDCKYDVVPTNGTTGAFATVTFDPTQSYPVTTRGGGSASPYTCPAIPADMDNQGVGATIRAFALNTGDTSLSDADLDGYFDNVVLDTKTKVTTFDFEPEEEVVVEQPEEPVVVLNTCLLPDTANRQAFVPGTSDEKTVQTIFNENGYASVNVNSDQLDTQVWNVSPASTDTVNVTIKVLGKYANNNQVFGYYEAGQSTFVPLFKVGSHSAVVPELAIGDSIDVSIPVQSINSLGFELDTEGIDPTVWYSEPDMNVNNKDVLAVYNPSTNVFLLAFEDLTEGDNDYNDLVVELTDISCVEDTVIVDETVEESFSTGGSSSRSGGRRSASSDNDSAPVGSVLGASDTNVDGALGNGIGGDMPLVQGSQVTMLPVGAPNTGAGGASSNTPNYVVVLALMALLLLARTYRPVKA